MLLQVYLVDGTYELFHHSRALASSKDAGGREIAAVRGVLASVLGLITQTSRHIGVATDHVIESFRNGLWPGYKTGDGIKPDLRAQFPILEDALDAMGVTVWPMVEFEADDALASAAAQAAADPRVERVVICTPDKDLAQCVQGTRVVQLNRRTRITMDEQGVIAKFGIPCKLIPTIWRSSATPPTDIRGCEAGAPNPRRPILGKFGHLEQIPHDWRTWSVNASSPGALALTLARERDRALLFRDLATLRTHLKLFESVDALEWSGPTPRFAALAAQMQLRTKLIRR